MDALSFVKFWLTNNTNGNIKPHHEIRISESSTALGDSEVDLCEEDDSFFELEISLSDFSFKKNKTTPQENREEKQSTFSVSKSRVLPFVETTSKPQSPISPLKPSQKLRAFSFKNSPKTTEKKEPSSRSLNVRFRFEDETTTRCEDSVSSVSSSSKRFFDLIKPLYNKTTKKQSVSSVSTSPASSPAARGKQSTRSARRQLGKSRSASAGVGGMSPVKRLDESLQVQQDGIQSAILHCKKSFHGSRESSMLSRSISESSSQEKLSTSSSEDSYLFSRMSSDSSVSERSTDSLTSIKEQREKISD
ncbi:Membrane-associated kinase regulator 5 [Hirschfeldia incana]|nr:Membrane-associated kinase regulator 5 [Hirschfeldia incana]